MSSFFLINCTLKVAKRFARGVQRGHQRGLLILLAYCSITNDNICMTPNHYCNHYVQLLYNSYYVDKWLTSTAKRSFKRYTDNPMNSKVSQ